MSAMRSNNFLSKPGASNSKLTDYMDTFRVGGGSVVSGSRTQNTKGGIMTQYQSVQNNSLSVGLKSAKNKA